MTDKPEATKVESTAHYHATKLDVLAAAMFVEWNGRILAGGPLGGPPDFAITRAERLHTCYLSAAKDIADLDGLNERLAQDAARAKEPA